MDFSMWHSSHPLWFMNIDLTAHEIQRGQQCDESLHFLISTNQN